MVIDPIEEKLLPQTRTAPGSGPRYNWAMCFIYKILSVYLCICIRVHICTILERVRLMRDKKQNN